MSAAENPPKDRQKPHAARAEELIAEVYRQVRQLRSAGEAPGRVLMHPAQWEAISRYRQSVGTVSGPVPDYLAENDIFGLEIWYHESWTILVR